MIPSALRNLAPGLVLTVLLLPTLSLAAPQSVAVLTLEYQQSERKSINDGKALFGIYLGTGTGVANGALKGTVAWDLYEDQSRADMHPTLFRGFIERDGKRHPFQIIGVLTPDGLKKTRHWFLSGTIVFEDSKLLGVRHAPVTGSVETGVWKHRYTVWVDPDESPLK